MQCCTCALASRCCVGRSTPVSVSGTRPAARSLNRLARGRDTVRRAPLLGHACGVLPWGRTPLVHGSDRLPAAQKSRQRGENRLKESQRRNSSDMENSMTEEHFGAKNKATKFKESKRGFLLLFFLCFVVVVFFSNSTFRGRFKQQACWFSVSKNAN